jgi:hypothetical protein
MKPFRTAVSYAADLQQAYDYFEQGGSLADDRFLERHDEIQRTIIAHPVICRLRSHGWRQLAIPRSTYAIFYREAAEFWFVGGGLSTVQDPDMLQTRLLILEISEPDESTD